MIFHFSTRKSNAFLTFSYKIVMILNFLFLKVPVSCSKRYENSPASEKSMILFITPAKMRFPGQ